MLDPDRLMSLNEHGDRVAIIPAEVQGPWRTRRNWVQAVLIVVFLILPWTKVNGLQTIFLDIPNRKFTFFGLTLWAHDAPMIFFLLLASTLGLAFVTSIWGRVWCGWACPQTVFIDGVFRRIENWIEGNYVERRKLLTAPWTALTVCKKLLKWFLFFVVSSVIAHSLVAYFTGAQELLGMIEGGPHGSWTYFVIISVVSLVLLFDFGWFREQFCIIMCPYGRIQSLLMDQNSLAVIYDEKRGEPRKGKSLPHQKSGDCVSCNRCVQVCPTACDIRKGVQLECIACTACIDACDDIMAKLKKPKGLIRYGSSSGQKNKLTSARSFLYLGIIFIATSVLIFNLAFRKDADILLLRGSDRPYEKVQNEEKILNHFKLHIKNQSRFAMKTDFKISDESKQQGIRLVMPPSLPELAENQDTTIHVFVEFPVSLTAKEGQFSIPLSAHTTLSEMNKVELQILTLKLIGPKKAEN